MIPRLILLSASLVLVLSAAVASRALWHEKEASPSGWEEVAPGVLRSRGNPAAYVIRQSDAAIAIDCPAGADFAAVKWLGIAKIELVLLTHHHRDTAAQAARLVADKVPVRAPKASAEWLLPEGVAKYWRDSIPLRNSRTAYLVLPVGIAGIDCSLQDGQTIKWGDWELQIIATPGHSRDHVSFLARQASGGRESPVILFAGDALSAPGKIWSPYTTDWDHWTDAGLKPAAESLRKLAALKPTLICPAHGETIKPDAVDALRRTAEVVEEVGFLKSYARFTQRLGNPPAYKFLAKVQAGTAGEKPWSRLSEHLFYTGNTYVLVAQDKSLMVYDPWGKRSVEQIQKLQKDHHLGPVELVMFSHAHFDHYDGVYDLAERDRYQVWALEEVALPIADPFKLRAPFLDSRPVKFERRFKDGASANWKEYTFKFHHFPGQTYYTMAVETTIDGQRCVFTGDNFFHVDLYSGTGGWMGLNRSWPSYYRQSAQKLLELHPEWVLAEHGGAFEFNEEDIKRRVEWAEAAGKAADALSPSGKCLWDWDPHQVRIQPLVFQRDQQLVGRLCVPRRRLGEGRPTIVQLDGRGILEDAKWSFGLETPLQAEQEVMLKLKAPARPGRHVFPLRTVHPGDIEDGADAFVVVEVAP